MATPHHGNGNSREEADSDRVTSSPNSPQSSAYSDTRASSPFPATPSFVPDSNIETVVLALSQSSISADSDLNIDPALLTLSHIDPTHLSLSQSSPITSTSPNTFSDPESGGESPPPYNPSSPTAFTLMQSPPVPIRLPDQDEEFARLDAEVSEKRQFKAYVEDCDDEDDHGGEEILDRDNMVGRGRPGFGRFYMPGESTRGSQAPAQAQSNDEGLENSSCGDGQGGGEATDQYRVFREKMKGGADWPWVEGEAAVGKGEEVIDEEGEQLGKRQQDKAQGKKFQDHMQERMPYVQMASRRLQAVMGVRNDLPFKLPNSRQLKNLPRLPDGSLDRNKLPPHIRALYTAPGTSQEGVDLNSLPRLSDPSQFPAALQAFLKSKGLDPKGSAATGSGSGGGGAAAAGAGAAGSNQAKTPEFDVWKLPPSLRHLYKGPESLASTNADPKKASPSNQPAKKPPNILIPPSGIATEATQKLSSAFSSTVYIAPRMSFNNKKAQLPLNPILDDPNFDPKTGKGLREWLLTRGKELGMRKRECKSISFHDLTPDMRTNDFSNVLLGHYTTEGNGERIDAYEVDLPSTIINPRTKLPVPTTETWIWFLISRPVVSFAIEGNSITCPPNTYFTSSSVYGRGETFMNPPPNFPDPIPDSWVVFALPLANITVHPEIVENFSSGAGGMNIFSSAVMPETKPQTDLRRMPEAIARQVPTPGFGPVPASGSYSMGISGSSSSRDRIQGSTTSRENEDLDTYNSNPYNLSTGNKVHKRTDFDMSHQGLPIFEFSTLTSPYLNNRFPTSIATFLSVEGIGGWYTNDTFKALENKEYTEVFLNWRKWLSEQGEVGEDIGAERGIGGKGRNRKGEVPSVFAGTWWGEFVQRMWDDSWGWERIGKAMGMGKCRVVVRWEDWERVDVKGDGDVEMEMGEGSGVGLGLKDSEGLKNGLGEVKEGGVAGGESGAKKVGKGKKRGGKGKKK